MKSLVAVAVLAAFMTGCAVEDKPSVDQRFDAVYTCKKGQGLPGELYNDCLRRLLPTLSEDEIYEVIDQGYDQQP